MLLAHLSHGASVVRRLHREVAEAPPAEVLLCLPVEAAVAVAAAAARFEMAVLVAAQVEYHSMEFLWLLPARPAVEEDALSHQ